jgi:hypothetical protein
MIFISLLLITVLVFFLLYVYAKDDNINDFATEIYAYAGGIQTKPPLPVFELTNEYIFYIEKDAYSSHHKDMQVVRVCGNSVEQFTGNIADYDRVLVDKSCKIESLVVGDVVLLCKIKPNGNKLYKLRSFLKLGKGEQGNLLLSSQTTKQGLITSSQHVINNNQTNKNRDTNTDYIGKIIAKENDFYKNAKKVAI